MLMDPDCKCADCRKPNPMSEKTIPRYEMEHDGEYYSPIEAVPKPDGAWVKYSDIAPMLEILQRHTCADWLAEGSECAQCRDALKAVRLKCPYCCGDGQGIQGKCGNCLGTGFRS